MFSGDFLALVWALSLLLPILMSDMRSSGKVNTTAEYTKYRCRRNGNLYVPNYHTETWNVAMLVRAIWIYDVILANLVLH